MAEEFLHWFEQPLPPGVVTVVAADVWAAYGRFRRLRQRRATRALRGIAAEDRTDLRGRNEPELEAGRQREIARALPTTLLLRL